jgi:hypothetical protein
VTANSTPGATASERDEAATSTTAKSTSATATTSTTASAADASAKGRTDTTRRVKLTLSRVDPFSVLKISFLLSVALGIAAVVAVAVLWGMLNGMGVFSTITESVNELQSGAQSGNKVDIGDWFSFGRVLALAVVFGGIDVILLTAIATLTAFVYNVCATLLGGVQVTLSDD